MHPSMFLLNTQGPFISEKFAERFGRLVIEEKYPPHLFSTIGVGKVVDNGETWRVTFENGLAKPGEHGLPMSEGLVVPWRLTIEIRKANGEVLAIL